jgi:hypothetical protein
MGKEGASRQVSVQSSQSSAGQRRKTTSFLNPTGVDANTAPPKEIGAWVEMAVFFSYVMISAFHPIFIDMSKSVDANDKKYYAYQPISTVVLMTLLISVATIGGCYVAGGKREFEKIWNPKPLMLFSVNGAVYALGDYLQMASMGSLQGAAYQILMQTRIILTASMMICVKGVFQTRLQWTLLGMLMCSMSVYMVVESGNSSGGGGGVPLMGMVFAFSKVILSCASAVVSDKYMKVYSDDSTNVQIARIHVGRAVGIVVLSFFTPVYSNGFFEGWDGMTWAVTGAFIVKSVSSLYVVALLDSILKNIAESFAVLVIYGFDVLMPWVAKDFDVATFLAVLVVVCTCAAYVDSKEPIEKAAKYDMEEKIRKLGGGK